MYVDLSDWDLLLFPSVMCPPLALPAWNAGLTTLGLSSCPPAAAEGVVGLVVLGEGAPLSQLPCLRG